MIRSTWDLVSLVNKNRKWLVNHFRIVDEGGQDDSIDILIVRDLDSEDHGIEGLVSDHEMVVLLGIIGKVIVFRIADCDVEMALSRETLYTKIVICVGLDFASWNVDRVVALMDGVVL